ncbi:MAG: type II secretion system protein GspG [candidate division NC10 bacterium]|nr:type II secretion system protein GspG [candidate division NC10 bacterium]
MATADQRGLTLLEMIVVLLLIGLVAAVVVPRVMDLIGPSKRTLTQRELLTLKRAIVGNPDLVAAGGYSQRGYEGDVGSLPDSLADLVTKPEGVANWDPWSKRGWNGPYIDDTLGDYLKDAWGTNYVYSKASRTISSNGPNKAPGGGDDLVVHF